MFIRCIIFVWSFSPPLEHRHRCLPWQHSVMCSSKRPTATTILYRSDLTCPGVRVPSLTIQFDQCTVQLSWEACCAHHLWWWRVYVTLLIIAWHWQVTYRRETLTGRGRFFKNQVLLTVYSITCYLTAGAFLALAVWGGQRGGQICIGWGKNSGWHNTWLSEWRNLTPAMRCHVVNTGIL